MWPDRRIADLLKIDHPILQAPMAGAATPDLAAAVCNAGGMGALGSAEMSLDQISARVAQLGTETQAAFARLTRS